MCITMSEVMRAVELPNDCILVFEVSKCWQVRATIGQRQGSVGIARFSCVFLNSIFGRYPLLHREMH